MLTRRQIMRLAGKNKIPGYTQERDYVQTLFLYCLYPEEDIVFKGGTALRLVHKSNRYSEDLDFNSYTDRTEKVLKDAVERLGDFGIEGEVKDEYAQERSYSFRLVYKGPLYVTGEKGKGGIEIEVSLREESIEKKTKFISSQYEDINDFLITVLSIEHITAEKVRALMVRKKPRDLYDLWFLINKGIQIEKKLLDRKLRLYDREFKMQGLREAIDEVEDGWERDLETLLPTIPDFEDVSSEVLEKFQDSVTRHT